MILQHGRHKSRVDALQKLDAQQCHAQQKEIKETAIVFVHGTLRDSRQGLGRCSRPVSAQHVFQKPVPGCSKQKGACECQGQLIMEERVHGSVELDNMHGLFHSEAIVCEEREKEAERKGKDGGSHFCSLQAALVALVQPVKVQKEAGKEETHGVVGYHQIAVAKVVVSHEAGVVAHGRWKSRCRSMYVLLRNFIAWKFLKFDFVLQTSSGVGNACKEGCGEDESTGSPSNDNSGISGQLESRHHKSKQAAVQQNDQTEMMRDDEWNDLKHAMFSL